jgi:hypothetical protein
MPVRIKVEIQAISGKTKVYSSTLLNSGFQGQEAQILIPARVARELGFLPRLPANALMQTFEAVAGSRIRLYTIADAVKVRAMAKGIETKPVICSVVISKTEREIISNDKLIDKLKIVLECPGKGLWRFRNHHKIRRSAKAQYW